jgi:hypothetical protein
MATFLGAFPVVPGKTDDARKFAEEVNARRDEFGESQRRSGNTEEQWSLQETPDGAMVVVHFESSDVEQTFARLAESTDDFDVWFRRRVQEVTGVDLASPLGAPPEIVVDWSA